MRLSIFLVFLFFLAILILVFFMKCRHERLSSSKYWVNKNKDLHKNLLNFLDITIDRLETNGIETFIMAGALLGSLRNGNLIPWDDDIDIGIYHAKNDEQNLINKIKSIYKNIDDSFIEEDKSGFLPEIKIKNLKNPNVFIEIFFYSDFSPDTIQATRKMIRTIWPSHFFKTEEIKNLSTCLLGNKKYKCPSDSISVVKRWYGDDCIFTPKITHIHFANKFDVFTVGVFSLFGYHKIRERLVNRNTTLKTKFD